MPEVTVIGAGPVGLLMAAELQRRGVDAQLVEQRVHSRLGTRAIGVHPPVLAALEGSGITEQLLAQALRIGAGEARSAGRVLGTVRFDRLNTRFPFVATLPQAATEQVLASRAPQPQRGVGITALRAHRDCVEWDTEAGAQRSPLVVLAAGARSRGLVYRRPESQLYADRYLMTDAHVEGDPDPGTAIVHLGESGVLESFPLPGGRRRLVAWDPGPTSSDPDQQRGRMDQALRGRADAVVEQVSSFGVRRFVAPRMRNHRLFVIGDCAHEVSPIGGQGMNLGLLDAATLAPLLAQWVAAGGPPEDALHRWEQARLRSARRAAMLAELNTRLGRPAGSGTDALRRAGLRTMLSPGPSRLFAHAYAMGGDAHA